MPDLIELAAKAAYNDGFLSHAPNDAYRWDDISEEARESWRKVARAALAAARPLIEAEVRNAVAAELVASTITTSTPLSEYRAQVKAEALREAADRWPMAWPIQGHEWLRARADQISRGGGDRAPEGETAAHWLRIPLGNRGVVFGVGETPKDLAKSIADGVRALYGEANGRD